MNESSFVLNCDFSFQCPIDWEDLESTSDKNQRFCQVCNQRVYYINSNAELAAARSKGYCVAAKLIEPQQPQEPQEPQKLVAGNLSPYIEAPLPNGREFLEIRALLSHHLHQGNFKRTIEVLALAESRFDLNWWEKCHEWVLQELANILEIGDSAQRDTALEIACVNEYYTNYLEPLVIIMAQRGCYEFAIALANSFQYSSRFPAQKKAIVLAEIANLAAKFGDLERASTLIAQSWDISLTDVDVEASEIAAQFTGILPSRGIETQSIALKEIAILAAEVSLVDLAIQIIRSIQYEPVRNNAMRAINGR